jgi:phosphatidylglycerol---prolipoprotein diacylglyceryl transferase
VPISLIPWFKLEAWQIPFPFIGSLPLQPFGLLVAIGILFGSRIAEQRAEKTGVPRYLVNDFLVHTIVIGGFACMVLNVLFYEPDKFALMGRAIASWFKEGPREPFPYPGLSSFGGFFGGTLAAIWFRQKRRVSLMVLGDIFCFAFPFAWMICRTGCFVVHDHPGVVSDFFLAVDNYYGEGQPRHDLGLYEVIWAMIMIPIVLWLARKPRPWGFFMAFVPIAYAPVRFGLDFLRETPAHGGDVRYFGLTPGQYAAIVLLLAGIGVAVRVARGPQPTLMLPGAEPLPPDPRADSAATPDAGRTKPKPRPAARSKQRAK